MLARFLATLLAAVSLVAADLKVTSPTGGSSLTHDGISAELSGADGFTVQVQLIAGGQKADGSDATVIYSNTATLYSGSKIPISVPAAQGPIATFNAYYLKIIGTPSGGGPNSFAFSQRFKVTDMTGSWANDAIKAAAQTAAASGNSAVPPDVNGGSGAGAAAGGAAAASSSGLAFSLQTGIIKYAPMQSKPGSTITATNTAPLYPTSHWSVFTTNAPIPSQISTATPSRMDKVTSRENTGSPVAGPTGDMAKFLARWVD